MHQHGSLQSDTGNEKVYYIHGISHQLQWLRISQILYAQSQEGMSRKPLVESVSFIAKRKEYSIELDVMKFIQHVKDINYD